MADQDRVTLGQVRAIPKLADDEIWRLPGGWNDGRLNTDARNTDRPRRTGFRRWTSPHRVSLSNLAAALQTDPDLRCAHVVIGRGQTKLEGGARTRVEAGEVEVPKAI